MTRSICITGANRGIGLALTKNYLEQSWKVFAIARHTDQLEDVRASYQDQLCIIKADITKEEDCQALASQFTTTSLDILINNAGVLLDRSMSFSDLSPAVLRESFEVNVFGSIAVTKALLPALKRSSQPVLAMISSLMGSIAENSSGGYYAYRSSKAALNMVTQSLAKDFPWLIALALHPGWVKTDMGGPQAPTTVHDSVKGLVEVIGKVKAGDSGRFINYRGESIAW